MNTALEKKLKEQTIKQSHKLTVDRILVPWGCAGFFFAFLPLAWEYQSIMIFLTSLGFPVLAWYALFVENRGVDIAKVHYQAKIFQNEKTDCGSEAVSARKELDKKYPYPAAANSQ